MSPVDGLSPPLVCLDADVVGPGAMAGFFSAELGEKRRAYSKPESLPDMLFWQFLWMYCEKLEDLIEQLANRLFMSSCDNS